MFVHPTRRLTLGAVLGGTLALGACSDPEANTDLRPEGPPDVLAVLVFNDPVNTVVETGTYCKENDPKRPEQVGIPAFGLAPFICPEGGAAAPELTDADPNAWYVRVMFDELLDPNVETLEPILNAAGEPTDNFTGSLATTQPVSLKCQGVDAMGNHGALLDVPYNGYYSPSGNNVTWPVGPSLVIKPIDPTIVAVESECEITLSKDKIHDKDGVAITDDDAKPFKFKIAPVSLIPEAQSNVDGDAVDPIAAGGIDYVFNVATDGVPDACANDTMAPAGTCFTVTAKAPTPAPTGVFADGSGGGDIFVGWDMLDDAEYTVTAPTMLTVSDQCGAKSMVKNLPDPVTITTNKFKLVAINPAGGNAVAASKHIAVTFNQLIDPASFVEGEDWTLTPKPAGFAVVPTAAGNGIQINGLYNINTNYVFTIKAGATVNDPFPMGYGHTLTIAAEQVSNYTTIASIAVTAQSPTEGSRIVKPAAAAAPVRLTFNAEMNPASLLPDEYTLTKADGSAVTLPGMVTPTAAGGVLTVPFTGLPAGGYTFTLKQGATIEDKIVPPNVYTAPANRVIHFFVADAATPADFHCLGQ